MSTVAEKAALEAATAEAELTEAETEAVQHFVAEGMSIDAAVQTALEARETAPAEQPAEPDVPPEGAEPTEAQLRQLERETTRHLDKVRSIMGGFVTGFEPCAKCGGIGLDQPGPQPQGHELFASCPTCQGFGDVLTGSLKEGNQSRPCPDCRGRGYLEAVTADGVPLAPDGLGGGQVVPPVEQLVQPTNGEPADAAAAGVRMGTPAWMGDTSLGG